MTILLKLDTDKFSNLIEILDAYDSKLKDWKKHLVLDGKNIQSANVEQASWLAYYDEIRIELQTLLEFFDMKVKESRGTAVRRLLNKQDNILNEKTRERLIDEDPAYIKRNMLFLEVQELYNLSHSIVKQFEQRQYTLTNLTKIHQAQISDITLRMDNY